MIDPVEVDSCTRAGRERRWPLKSYRSDELNRLADLIRENEVLHERFSRLSEASLRINESHKTPEANGTLPPKN